MAVALKTLGYKVSSVYSDMTNPSVGIDLGMERANIGYRDVIYGKADINDAVAIHNSTGLTFFPEA